MALLIDDRRGSGEFLRALKRLATPAKVQRLKCADFTFSGNGPDGLCRVGIERKTVSEMVGTASRKRFVSGQLPKMLRRYGRHTWLIIEGYCTVDRHDGLLSAGRFEVGFGPERMMFEHWMKRRATLLVKSGVHVITTHNKTETAHTIAALYRWYQKPWAAHKSAYVVEEQRPDSLIINERTWRRQVLAQFPGVGWERSKTAARYYNSIEDALGIPLYEKYLTAAQRREVRADVAGRWQQALGFKKGGKIVRQLMARLRGEADRGAAKS